ncbi:replication initiation protein [Candidatus Photodesmus anomalopis]|uniref:Initiator replication protein n=1 Tax=Candidatus Photodesmus katoptron Akat1 TaxID=1236703 RepID=S3DZ29_9GAMM|nr:replication initiation protein [Candidatus Photodesmus katoptron]EPE37186.1 initiator replication protein [Candidatus Photodesmus katoptron Akat1]
MYKKLTAIFMSKSMKQSYLVKKHLPKHIKKGHQILFSRQDLSVRETDMFALMIAQMTPEDWKKSTPVYEFHASQISKWLSIKHKHIGSNLSPVAKRLSERKVGVKTVTPNGQEEFDYIPFFKRLTYKNSKLLMVPNDELRSEYIEYKKGFALINTQNFLNLKKEYSKRLYELLSRFKTSGTIMKIQKIEDLKGLFGILDEKGKLKQDKQSFKKNSVFMKRCIRDSIKEISENSMTKKEILFLESKDGHLGYQIFKNSKKTSGIEFLYRWIGKDFGIEINIKDAQKNIKEMEIKRLKNKQRLTVEELKLLANSYYVINRSDIALEVEQGIERRLKDQNKNLKSIESEEMDMFLSKLQFLKKASGNPDY